MATSIHAPALLLPSSAALPSPPASPALPRISSLPDYESDSNSDSDSDNDISYLDLPASSPPAAVDPRDATTPDRWIPRHSALIRLTGKHPLNCQPPLPLLRNGFLTPSPLHFVRNHGPVPAAPPSPALWLLHVTGSVPRPSSLTAADLASAFRPRRLPVTLVCAANRRREQNATHQSLGYNWGAGAVSTAVWTGARLRDVLRRCGAPSRPRRGMHVWFEGEDDLPGGGRGCKYGTSLPLEVAMDRTADVILAYEMNGQEIPPDHGYPVRLIIPGYIGGRMVKWLRRIVVAAEESPNYYHYMDNRVLPSHIDAARADAEGWWYKPEYIIKEVNVNSVITTPSHDEILPINSIASQSPYTLRGFAYSGGGRKVTRVEVTVDGGETWRLCELEHTERPTRYGKCWCWCFWSIHVEVHDLLDAQEIAVRAWDESLNTQPEKLIWNIMGMMNNCWFRVKINVCRQACGQISLAFEHPTVPGNDSGGWMIRQKQSPADAPPLKKTHSTPYLPSSPTPYSLSDVAGHSSRDSAWIVVHGVVYDCTSFLKDHPGGADSILINAGSDCTEEFDAIHSDKARKMLDKYRIGLLLPPATPPASPAAAPPPGVLTPRENIHVTLVSKSSLTHNVRLFRFALPASDRPLGLPVGKHLFLSAKVDGKLCMRAYTPVSYADEVGHFDLAVKVYPDGAMSRYLDGLPPGSAVAAKGPVGHVEYRGRGEFLVDGKRRSARRLTLIAGGTGITPVYQVVRAALRDAADLTEMWLVFANRTEEDVFMRREIEGCVEDGGGRLRAWFVTGVLGEEALRGRVPPFSAGETLALVCGPPRMVAVVRAGMVKLGFDEDSVVAF